MTVVISEHGGWWHREELGDPGGGPMFANLDACAAASDRFDGIRVRILPGFPLARWWAEQDAADAEDSE